MHKFVLVVKYAPDAPQPYRYVGPFITPEAAWKEAVYWHLDPSYHNRMPRDRLAVSVPHQCRPHDVSVYPAVGRVDSMSGSLPVKLWHGSLADLHLHMQKLQRTDTFLLPGKNLKFAIYKVTDEHWLYMPHQSMVRFESTFHRTFFVSAVYHETFTAGLRLIASEACA